MSDRYQKYLRHDCWVKQIRLGCLERAGHTCEVCRKVRATEAHHKHYASVGVEQPEDLVAVCASCHRRLHGLPVAANDNLQTELPLFSPGWKRIS